MEIYSFMVLGVAERLVYFSRLDGVPRNFYTAFCQCRGESPEMERSQQKTQAIVTIKLRRTRRNSALARCHSCFVDSTRNTAIILPSMGQAEMRQMRS
jgi:hypothetical protein